MTFMAAPPPQFQLIQRAVAAYQTGAKQLAADLSTQVLRQYGEEPNAHALLGVLRLEVGDVTGGIAHLERACALMPSHIHALTNLGVAYQSTGRTEQARVTLERALRVSPNHAPAHYALGRLMQHAGDLDGARDVYQRAVDGQSDHVNAIAELAWIAEEQHRLDDAIQLSERALRIVPRHPIANLARCRVALRLGDSTRAAELAAALLREGNLKPNNRALAEGLLGEAYDQIGEVAEAFAAFMRANDTLHALHEPAFGADSGPFAPTTVRRMTDFLNRTDPALWRAAPPPVREPVFLLGFPRSGTTLLEQILASHPQIDTLEERDNLADAGIELICGDVSLDAWEQLSPDRIEQLRLNYWQRVDAAMTATSKRQVFIDKLPLNSVYLPLIHRIFPSAKILLALRDPRDVTLSCFQQRFGMNAAMFQFLRLDSTVAYYDAVMSLVAASRKRLPLDVHEIRHEELVTDFEAQVRALLAFLGLQWDEAVRDYAGTARKRRIDTPSAAQVVRPLYRPITEKWRRYQRFLKPYLPVLEPWIQRFSYPPSPSEGT
ncbi:MAG: sulfotransferase [Proteobacteria bacterium]|nr:sulfotransferase [Pseudomonadota bacterium]